MLPNGNNTKPIIIVINNDRKSKFDLRKIAGVAAGAFLAKIYLDFAKLTYKAIKDKIKKQKEEETIINSDIVENGEEKKGE